MKTHSQPSRCEQLGACRVYGTCTQCLVAAQRHPFAPGVIQANPEPRSFAIAVRCLLAVALITMGSVAWLWLDLAGLIPQLWLLVA